MKIKNICVYNMYPAIMGIRNSYKSKEHSDSCREGMQGIFRKDNNKCIAVSYNHALIGKKDEKLLNKLLKKNNEYGHQERKFLRQILISMDIVGSIKFWAQNDTFKIATVRNSESTMHSITDGEISQSNFERKINPGQIDYINKLITRYNLVKSLSENKVSERFREIEYNWASEYKSRWRQDLMTEIYELIDANLPAGYVLESHWTGNYENLRNIYHGRKNHKMYWWKEFLSYIEKLPYFDLMIKGENEQFKYEKVDFKNFDSLDDIGEAVSNEEYYRKVHFKTESEVNKKNAS